MKNLRYILTPLLIILFTGCAATPATPPTPPTTVPGGLEQTASWVVREDQVMHLASGNAGRGTLLFRGWEHAFEFTGSRVSVTGTKIGDIEGEVYNLNKLEDFEGTYYPNAEFNAAHRVTGVWAHNDKGVTLHLRLQGENVGMNLEAQGATITLID